MFKKKTRQTVDLSAGVLGLVGGANWGLVSILNFDLVSWIANLTTLPVLDTIVKAVVGVASIYALARIVVGKYMK